MLLLISAKVRLFPSIKFIREKDNTQLCIFYDQTIPKIGRSEYYQPLLDKSRSSSFKRPDFIFHIKSSGFDSSFIADAKFKNLKKCMKDNLGTKLNSDHIVGKYTSGITQLGNFGRPPSFILGICLSDNTLQGSEFKSGLQDGVELFSETSPLVQCGALGLGYGGNEEVKHFFSGVLK